MEQDLKSPILILWDSETGYRLSGYVTEILHVEGYNWFTVPDLSRGALSLQLLEGRQIVIVAQVDLPEDIQEMLLTFLGERRKSDRASSSAGVCLRLGSGHIRRRTRDGRSICVLQSSLRAQRRRRRGNPTVPRQERAVHVDRRAGQRSGPLRSYPRICD